MKHVFNMLPTSCLFLDGLMREGEIRESAISKQIKKSDIFSQLVNAKALLREKRGRGAVWVVAKPDVIQHYRKYHCPDFTPDEMRKQSTPKTP